MWTLQDAKNRFSAVVEAALAGVPQEVTRRGKPAVVVIAAEDYARLRETAGNGRGSFIDYLKSMPVLGDDDDFLKDRPIIKMRDIDF
jgi:antitoxin Phd